MQGLLESLLSADWVKEQLTYTPVEFWVFTALVFLAGYTAGRWHADRIDRHELERLREESRHVLSRQTERMREVTAAHERRVERLRDELEARHRDELSAIRESYESRITELEAELDAERAARARREGVERGAARMLAALPSRLKSILRKVYDEGMVDYSRGYGDVLALVDMDCLQMVNPMLDGTRITYMVAPEVREVISRHYDEVFG